LNAALPALAGSVAAAVASLAGVALVQARPGWTRASALPLAAFSGGIILGTAFLHLLPEAMERAGDAAPMWALAAFLALYVLETHVVPHHHHHEHDHAHDHDAAARHAAVPAEAHAAHAHANGGGGGQLTTIAAIAFGLHAAFDGVALGVGFSPVVALGSSATIGVLAHKVPEGIALASLLLRGGMKPARAFAAAAGIAALTPLATLLAVVLLDESVAEAAMGRLLALVAGSFVYVAAADLLPEVAHHPRISRTALMVLGLGVAVVVRTWFA
jgi:zinc and cadmium transporter